MILEVFLDSFWVKIVIGWSKNLCNLIIAVGFNFDANLTIRSYLNRWDQSITVGSSQDFKYDRLIYPDISQIFYQQIKLTHVCATNPIFSRYIGSILIYRRYYRFFLNFSLNRLSMTDIISTFTDIQYIGDISDILNL